MSFSSGARKEWRWRGRSGNTQPLPAKLEQACWCSRAVQFPEIAVTELAAGMKVHLPESNFMDGRVTTGESAADESSLTVFAQRTRLAGGALAAPEHRGMVERNTYNMH